MSLKFSLAYSKQNWWSEKKKKKKNKRGQYTQNTEAEEIDGTKRYKRMQGRFKNKQPLDTARTVHTLFLHHAAPVTQKASHICWHRKGMQGRDSDMTWICNTYSSQTAHWSGVGPKSLVQYWLGFDSMMQQGIFSHSQFSVQTLLQRLYTPLCNGMHKHLCTL